MAHMRIPPTQAEIEELGKDVENVVRYFSTKKRFEYIDVVGTPGQQGGAIVLNERHKDGSFFRKIVAKFFFGATGEGSEQDRETARKGCEDEGRVLEMLRGFPHIVNLLYQGRVMFFDTPGLLMEYSAYGSIQNFMERLNEADVELPERVLWIVKACINLKWPLHTTTDIPAEDAPAADIEHDDIHAGNVLLHGLDYSDSEHSFGPWLKLIDFGHATVYNEYEGPGSETYIQNRQNEIQQQQLQQQQQEEQVLFPTDSDLDYVQQYDMMDVDEMEGVVTEVTETVVEMTTEDDDVLPFRSKNIHDCALLVASFAIGNFELEAGPYEVVVQTPGGMELVIETEAPVDLANAPITSNLRDLLYRCLSTDPDYFPTLHEVYYQCQEIIYNTDEQDFMCLPDGRGICETDEYIQALLQRFVHDADDDDEALAHGKRMSAPAEFRKRGVRTKFPRVQLPYRPGKSQGNPLF
ncbi:hypothetical protein F5Y04DRAFT_275679 [Hypomontagnella monticulosa]|nr:hypothetical protein F5Y04DRAFT_275679 [Hypomontagnella monticulosa]